MKRYNASNDCEWVPGRTNKCGFPCHRSRRPRPQPRGVAAVEFALILPLVLLLTLACVDLGRVVHAYLVVSNAARCGAQYGSMHEFTNYTRPSWESQIRTAIEGEMNGLRGFSSSNLQSTYTTTTDSDGLFQLVVKVNYPFNTIVTWPGVPSQLVLSHQVEMRQIR
jgi:Flp pilus assembly protein TadG